MKKSLVVLLVTLFAAQLGAQNAPNRLSLIPRPAHVQLKSGKFTFSKTTSIVFDQSNDQLRAAANYLAGRLRKATGFAFPSKDWANAPKGDVIILSLVADADLGKEGYQIDVTKARIELKANQAPGLLYAVESLFQMLPPGAYSSSPRSGVAWQVPSVSIKDAPRFGWRGMHLDVSRHFFPKEFIYTYIDMLAMHKLNVFHWHLVDDQGWRLEIKKYPRLTDIGAWRVDREDQHWNARDPQEEGEAATYGGFYTQDQVRDIVAYAAGKNITIVPEIEMPAHVSCALAAYPQFSCTGGPFTVPPGGVWPITDIYCAGNDSTFIFLEDVLTEVMDLFPSTYIHIGGDEATKTEWEQCDKCQARIDQEDLEDEAELQSYFVKRIEKFLVSKGRRLIGWDEILEGGLAPEATVMSWRGVAGGIAAARAGHDAVMTPTSNCYFDYYQGRQDLEPLAIGGFLPLSQVYDYEPVPDSLTVEEAKHILGAQANVWTEYIPTPEHAQYMTLPRMAAMAEVGWSPKEGKDWNDFARRIDKQLQRYASRGYNYAPSAYAVSYDVRLDSLENAFTVGLSNEMNSSDLRLTLDGSDPVPGSKRYDTPLRITHSTTIRAAAFSGKTALGKISEQEVLIHKALGKPVWYVARPERYTGGGDSALTNGIRGSFAFNDGNWQGFRGKDFEGTVDLGQVLPIGSIATTHLQNTYSWIFFPVKVEFLVGDDETSFASVAVFERPSAKDHDGPSILEFRQRFRELSGRFVKIKMTNIGTCPEWHIGNGEPAWALIDEIVVE